jgi:MFS family permease
MRTSFFYGYVVLALCFLNMFLMRGTAASFSVFYVALLEEFRWSHGVAASIASVNALVYALTSPLVGWSFDRLGPRVLMPLGGGFVGMGLFLSGKSDSLWALYLSYGIIAGAGLGSLGFVSNSALISHWFHRRRGMAMGLATMGLGLGVLIIVPLTQLLISRFGWRTAFLLLGGLVLFTCVPMNLLFQRRSPNEMGQFPDGEESPRADGLGDLTRSASGTRQWSLQSAFRSFPYWSITLGHLAVGTGISVLHTHLVAHLVNQGVEKLTAAFMFGLVGLTWIPGTALWGVVSDRLGRDKAYGIATLITVAGVAGLVFIGPDSPQSLIYTCVILFGLGNSAGTLTYGATIADIFGGSKVGTIFGFLEVSFGLGMACGPWFGGYVFDLTGSYRWAFALGVLAYLVSYLAVRASLAWHCRGSTACPETGKLGP